jgi:hypothetical protein
MRAPSIRWRDPRAVHRIRIYREQKALAESYSGAPKEALASWTSIKNLRFVSSFREPPAPELRKQFLSILLEVSPEEIDFTQM